MCQYCDMTLVDVEHACDEYFIHKPLYVRNSENFKRIKADGNHPMMYLKEYRQTVTHIWALVCEFADDNGTVIETPICYCPKCGDKLVGKNNG